MSTPLHIVVCGSLVPDPLQTLEPVTTPQGPGLKNETMLPSVLDPWSAHALFEAANLAKQVAGSKVWLVSLGPKGKLQQLMMTVAQKVPFELVAIDGSASGFTDAHLVAAALADAIQAIPGLDKNNLLVFGGCASASRDASVTMQLVCERLGISGKYQASTFTGAPAVLAWATGNLPEPPNNPQVGMLNMRGVMPALQKAKAVAINAGGIAYEKAEIPAQKRDTRIVKDMPADDIAKEIVEWLKA